MKKQTSMMLVVVFAVMMVSMTVSMSEATTKWYSGKGGLLDVRIHSITVYEGVYSDKYEIEYELNVDGPSYFWSSVRLGINHEELFLSEYLYPNCDIIHVDFERVSSVTSGIQTVCYIVPKHNPIVLLDFAVSGQSLSDGVTLFFDDWVSFDGFSYTYSDCRQQVLDFDRTYDDEFGVTYRAVCYDIGSDVDIDYVPLEQISTPVDPAPMITPIDDSESTPSVMTAYYNTNYSFLLLSFNESVAIDQYADLGLYGVLPNGTNVNTTVGKFGSVLTPEQYDIAWVRVGFSNSKVLDGIESLMLNVPAGVLLDIDGNTNPFDISLPVTLNE